jgi:hypothetical protein
MGVMASRPRSDGPGTTVGDQAGAVDLYWIPLGAGAPVVRAGGKLYELGSALAQRRARVELYHSALEVFVPQGRYVIELTPVPDLHGEERGVVAEGPVGPVRPAWAGRLRLFRYEVRRWHGGLLPDADFAVASPVRVSDDPGRARQLLDLVPSVPTHAYGSHGLLPDDMWNSNSVTAWLLARSGVTTAGIDPPLGGRAPGWNAGLAAAARDGGLPELRTATPAADPTGRRIDRPEPA